MVQDVAIIAVSIAVSSNAADPKNSLEIDLDSGLDSGLLGDVKDGLFARCSICSFFPY